MAVGRMRLSMSPLSILSLPMVILMLRLHQAARLVGPGLTPVRYFMETWKTCFKKSMGKIKRILLHNDPILRKLLGTLLCPSALCGTLPGTSPWLRMPGSPGPCPAPSRTCPGPGMSSHVEGIECQGCCQHCDRPCTCPGPTPRSC